MAYRNNPDRDFRSQPYPDTLGPGWRGIIAASLAVLIVVVGLIYALTNRDQVAPPSANNRSPVSSPARDTTGNTPGGASTIPAKPFHAPAPR